MCFISLRVLFIDILMDIFVELLFDLSFAFARPFSEKGIPIRIQKLKTGFKYVQNPSLAFYEIGFFILSVKSFVAQNFSKKYVEFYPWIIDYKNVRRRSKNAKKQLKSL